MLCCFESKARPDRTDDQTAEVVVLERHVQMSPVPIVRSAQKFRDSNPRFRTTLPTKSGVVPEHYTQLIDMVVTAPDFDEFVQRGNADGSVWENIESLDQIHEGQIENELRALEALAKQRKNLHIPQRLSMMFGAPGCRPNPLVISRQFSAAIEYLKTSVRKVAVGAKPRKNDRGLYVDWQLLMYLADPNVSFLTNEDFSGEISTSAQKDRIIKPDALV